MRFDIQAQGLEKVRHLMDRLSSEQIQQAQVDAMTDAAHHIRRAMAAEAKRAFDQPTPYILRSFIFKPPTLQHPQTTVLPTYYNRQGVDPQKVLRAQAFGGRRRDKRMELALRRLGLLPAGMQVVLPATPYPGSTDGRGNFRGAFVQQMLSYLSGDMKKTSLRRLHRKGVDEHGRVTIQGRRYFVSPGPAGGVRLQAGVWAASGTHGRNLAPVAIFARAGNYSPLYDTERIARAADAVPYLAKRMRYHIRKAAGV